MHPSPSGISLALELPQPYLLFLGDTTGRGFAKTALGIADWAADRCVAEYALPDATVTTGLPRMTPIEAHSAGARSMVIGVATQGGTFRDSWIPALIEAMEAGLDIISGMHSSYVEVEALRQCAERTGQRFIEVRRPPAGIPVGTGAKRNGKRLLTVGTDCALGKKYTALALARGFAHRGIDSDFRATGQTGIMIAGQGIPIDAVVSDFVAGAAEILSPSAPDHHWDIIEGQGSIFHPSYAGVSLGLLHGSQPDVIVLCHAFGRTEMLGMPGVAMPTIIDTFKMNVELGSRTNPGIRCAGISLNTAHLDADAAADAIDQIAKATGLPTADPVRGGASFEQLVDACVN